MRVHRTPIGFLVSYSWREVQKKARKAIGPVARGDEDHDGDNDDARDRAGGGSFFRRLRDPHVFLRTLKAVPWVLRVVHGMKAHGIGLESRKLRGSPWYQADKCARRVSRAPSM